MSPYIATESKIVALAAAIHGANDPDEAIAKALAAGLKPEEIETYLEAAMERDFLQRMMERRNVTR